MKLTDLSDDDLVSRLEAICLEGRRLQARLLVHLIEVEERRLHLKAACSSLFDFCLRRLGMSEGTAFRRINAARLVRRFPGLLARIERGEVHLSTLVLLRDHLTAANVDDLVTATSGKRKREVEELLARHAPRPDVPSTLRKLPAPTAARNANANPNANPNPNPNASANADANANTPRAEHGRSHARPAFDALCATGTTATSASSDANSTASSDANSTRSSDVIANAANVAKGSTGSKGTLPLPSGRTRSDVGVARPRARIEPLSEARYKLQLTASAELRDKLERARDLMAHRNRSGDLAVVVERALDVLLERLEKERLGKTARPRRPARAPKSGRVVQAVRREVFERDGEQCTFVDDKGQRCPSRAFLELDHVTSRALGGPDDAANLRVACRSHNLHHAEEVFGQSYVARRIHFRQRKSQASPPPASVERGAVDDEHGGARP